MSLLHPLLGNLLANLALVLLRLHLRVRGTGRERGDVPGWVLVTMMTAGLLTPIWAFAGNRLMQILTTALNGVAGP